MLAIGIHRCFVKVKSSAYLSLRLKVCWDNITSSIFKRSSLVRQGSSLPQFLYGILINVLNKIAKTKNY